VFLACICLTTIVVGIATAAFFMLLNFHSCSIQCDKDNPFVKPDIESLTNEQSAF
jgi:multisubunit Na+/H+ antiporter MnhC subunit